MLNYLKQMLLISNMERCKFVILQHLLSNSHFFQVWQPNAQPSLAIIGLPVQLVFLPRYEPREVNIQVYR